MKSYLRCLVSKVLGAHVCQLNLALYVVDADLALLHQFLHEIEPQCDELCARTVGTVAGGVLP